MTTSEAVARETLPQEGGHWSNIARLWRQVSSPLRPTPTDVAVYAAAVRDWARTGGVPRALILGVTPELYRLPWPAGSDVAAVDRNRNMIDALWPGPRDAVVCADWRDLPFPTGSRDVTVCDGGISMLSYPADHREFVRSLHRVVAPGGLCVFRLYVPPGVRESPEAVLRDLLEAKIPNLNVLKLRLGMALQRSSEGGVELGHVWNVLREAAPDFPVLAERIGWDGRTSGNR